MEFNQRKYIRYTLTTPLPVLIKLNMLENKPTVSKRLIVGTMTNIGEGGISFKTSIDLPVRTDVFFDFSIGLENDTTHTFRGKLAWKQTLSTHKQFGVEFVFMNEREKAILSSYLQSQLQLSLIQ